MKLFPDGFGTRALLAFIIVAGAVGSLAAIIFMPGAENLKETALSGLLTLAMTAVGFYFLDRKNGGGHAKGDPGVLGGSPGGDPETRV